MTDADHGRPLPQTAEQWRLLQTQKLLELFSGAHGRWSFQFGRTSILLSRAPHLAQSTRRLA